MIRVLLADEQRITRAGVQKLLESESNIEVVASCEDLETAIRRFKGLSADVMIIDLPSFVDGVGIEQILSELVASTTPEQRQGVLVLTVIEDLLIARRAIEAGCNGYLLKRDAPSQLIEAVRKVAEGERYVSPTLAGNFLATDGHAGELTERETEVLRHIALGFTNSEAAERLNLSVRTIESHRAAIMEKLQVSNRAGMVGYALRNGLIR
ncbi:MAG: response regulator transcription factor [Solirubrobacterales bacterium]|nr:response regulator transcription factor [Solirubrobacterales bacterium]